ncbi:MAG: aconitase/3-isopropylmalate dehydratase large subunit family protein [Synergistetes bacterium]|nr:aconitase/3-isopropylmalate dehydratase large subunit family protein [Synergistota bacterium]MCX8127274.1 aconitase/3-isopropylmalate dehydratase large subunit family protein [Synergistota bacterium]
MASNKLGREVKAGERVWLPLDLIVIRDFAGPNAILQFEEVTGGKGKVFDPERIAITFDYQVPAKDEKVANNQKICRDFAERQGIKYFFDVNAGIGQHVLLEKGLITPGSVVIGTDSHMNLLGAVESFSTGVGNTDIVAGFILGKLWFRIPQSVKVVFNGRLEYPVTSKDVTLFFVSEFGGDGANYLSIEFSGEVIDSFSLADRITLASMVTETGGKIGFIVPNEEIKTFLEERSRSKVEVIDPDSDANYLEVREYDISDLEPLVSCPHVPENVKKVRELKGVKVDEVFIGSCTNGRYEDFKLAYDYLLKVGKEFNPKVKVIFTPATKEVTLRLLEEGIAKAFVEAGGVLTNPGCSLCTIGHHGILAKGEVLLSTSNRNFQGKLGKGSYVYLCSPLTAIASAITGEITDPRDLL